MCTDILGRSESLPYIGNHTLVQIVAVLLRAVTDNQVKVTVIIYIAGCQ